MSLARAFTKRTKHPEMPPPSPIRLTGAKKGNQSYINRAQISSPVALISTTNMLSYNAPDLPTARQVSSSSSSSHSSEDSDHTTASSVRSRETLTDASSVDSSPTSPVPNHLSQFFQSAQQKQVRRSVSSGNLHRHRKTYSIEQTPALPHRAPSHSKQAHEQLARKRSLQHLPGSSRTSHSSGYRASRDTVNSKENRTSVDIFKGNVEPNHPFGKELEQLNEVVEELHVAVRDAEVDEDTALMSEKGLMKFCAADYLMEIEPLFARMFLDRRHVAVATTAWI